MTRALFIAAWVFAATAYIALALEWRWVFLTASVAAAVSIMVWGLLAPAGGGR